MKTAHQITAEIDLANTRSDFEGVNNLLNYARVVALSIERVTADDELLSYKDGSTLRIIDGGSLLIPYEGKPDYRPESTRYVQVLSIPRR